MQITWSPNLSDELSLRIGPLHEAWEARGPGLLKGIAARAGSDFLVSEATVVPVYPTSGGGGQVDAARRVVKMEAVLANPHPHLPEVVRLAWLLARLGARTSVADEHTWSLALTPIVLEAAEAVELAKCRLIPLTLALKVWNVEPERYIGVGGEVLAWWSAFRDSSQSLDEGVSALAHRLADLNDGPLELI